MLGSLGTSEVSEALSRRFEVVDLPGPLVIKVLAQCFRDKPSNGPRGERSGF
jgi:hypothetical protein